MSHIVVRQVFMEDGTHSWLVLRDGVELARFPNRRLAREDARRRRAEDAQPTFEVKERNPFIEGPMPRPMSCALCTKDITQVIADIERQFGPLPTGSVMLCDTCSKTIDIPENAREPKA